MITAEVDRVNSS